LRLLTQQPRHFETTHIQQIELEQDNGGLKLGSDGERGMAGVGSAGLRMPEPGCVRDPSESRLQLVVTVSCILGSYCPEHTSARESVRSVRWDTEPPSTPRRKRALPNLASSLDGLMASQWRLSD